MKNTNKGNTGPLVASVIIVIILIAVGFYSLKERPLKQEATPTTIDEVQILQNQGTSTEISDIEADLSATNLEDLDLDLAGAEAELQ